MRLTKQSKLLINFVEEVIKNGCISDVKLTNRTIRILNEIYKWLDDGYKYVEQIPSFNASVSGINRVSQIPKPSTFPLDAFTDDIMTHINKNSVAKIVYKFNLFGRQIEIIFVTENGVHKEMVKKYNTYVVNLLVWLHIINHNSRNNCADKLTIFIYHTSLLKMLPKSNDIVLNENNVNTAFTRTCPKNSEIVVFRKEEWFKVFIHETFHNFGLDFSDMDLTECKRIISNVFPVSSNMNIYEAYAEFWARTMNAGFVSYNMNKGTFLQNMIRIMNIERVFSFFQMAKVLNFMGLTYKNLYEKTKKSDQLRQSFYKEDSNVLAYYVITTILMNSYPDFLSWCDTHNNDNNNKSESKSLFDFTKNDDTIESFCDFIVNKYHTKTMTNGALCFEDELTKSNSYLNKTLRMTSYEIE